jgi:hypothetical protein
MSARARKPDGDNNRHVHAERRKPITFETTRVRFSGAPKAAAKPSNRGYELRVIPPRTVSVPITEATWEGPLFRTELYVNSLRVDREGDRLRVQAEVEIQRFLGTHLFERSFEPVKFAMTPEIAEEFIQRMSDALIIPAPPAELVADTFAMDAEAFEAYAALKAAGKRIPKPRRKPARRK